MEEKIANLQMQVVLGEQEIQQRKLKVKRLAVSFPAPLYIFFHFKHDVNVPSGVTVLLVEVYP